MAERNSKEADTKDTASATAVVASGGEGRPSAVDQAKLRARIESTPGGARYEEEAKKEAEEAGREYKGPQPGIGRQPEVPDSIGEREGTKKYRVEADDDKWTFDGVPFKKGDVVHLDDAQAKRAGKKVKAV